MKRIVFSLMCISLVSVGFAKAGVSDKNAQLIQAAKDEKREINFSAQGIKVSVPPDWQIVDCHDLKSIDDFTKQCQKHLDEYVRKHPERTCCLQKDTLEGLRPTIILIPGDGFIKESPENSNMKAGTKTSTSILAAQLAWLVIGKNKTVKTQGDVFFEDNGVMLAGRKEFAAKLKGDATMLGIVIDDRWQNLKMTIGLAAPPELLDDTIKTAEQIILQIDKSVELANIAESNTRDRKVKQETSKLSTSKPMITSTVTDTNNGQRDSRLWLWLQQEGGFNNEMVRKEVEGGPMPKWIASIEKPIAIETLKTVFGNPTGECKLVSGSTTWAYFQNVNKRTWIVDGNVLRYGRIELLVVNDEVVRAVQFEDESKSQIGKSVNSTNKAASNYQETKNEAKPKPKNLLPAFSEELQGSNPVRVKNPNSFAVSTGIRSGQKGVNFDVGANGEQTVYVPDGRYDIYFVYSDKPDALFQGDSFTLNNDGVEIQIVKVVNGNYNIRQVK